MSCLNEYSPASHGDERKWHHDESEKDYRVVDKVAHMPLVMREKMTLEYRMKNENDYCVLDRAYDSF